MEDPKPFVKFVRTYDKGAIIFEEGSLGQEMYVIASGAVKVTTMKQGRETLLNRMEAGEFFGEMALVDAALRSATAIADAENTRLVELDLDRFLYLVQQQPVFALTVMHTLCERIRRREALYMELVKKLAGDQVPEDTPHSDDVGGGI